MSPRLLFQVVSVEARKRMGYRADFWINTLVGFLAGFGVSFFVAKALFAESGAGELAGYSESGLILYFLSVLLIDKIVRGPDFGGNISDDIYDGGLSRYLLFPVPYLGFKYGQHLGALLPLFLQAILFGVLGAVVLEPAPDVVVTPGSIAACVTAMMLANLLYFLMRMPLQLVAFWQDNVWSLTVALRLVTALLGGAMVPLAFFPDAARTALQWMPFRLLFDWPTRTLLGRVDATEWWSSFALAIAWCLVFSAVGRLVWRRGDLRYTGVGI